MSVMMRAQIVVRRKFWLTLTVEFAIFAKFVGIEDLMFWRITDKILFRSLQVY